MFISVHIPKTAGTSLANVFDLGSDRKILYDYSADYSNVTFTPQEKEEFLKALPYLTKKYKFIHGHFYLKKYLDLIPSAKTITCFRHPLERVISQYKHDYYERLHLNVTSKLTIVDYVEDINIRNAHQVHLSSMTPNEIDHIFLHHDLQKGLASFKIAFPEAINNSWANVPTLNEGKVRENAYVKQNKEALCITKTQKKEVFNRMGQEIEYYKEALEAYQKQQKALL